MKTIYFLVLILAIALSVQARRININDNGNPIRIINTSYGQNSHERVDNLFAQIFPRHVTTNQRINFPSSGYINTYFIEAMAPGDERGHLIGSQFSGPAEWYNLSPQNARVNRNLGFQSITTDWYGTECEVRRFLDQGGNRRVDWLVRMDYNGNSNRPDTYHLTVEFYENGQRNGQGIQTHIDNPFLRDDSRFWICRQCRSSNHNGNDHDELRKRSKDGCKRS